jgi:hypothetical protein
MIEWTCIAYLPDGALCARKASIVDPLRRGMICARCAETDQQLESDPTTRAFSLAKRTVEASPLLRQYVSIILADWTRDDRFWHWIATASEEEIVDWVKTTIALHERLLDDYERVIREKDARIRELEARLSAVYASARG